MRGGDLGRAAALAGGDAADDATGHATGEADSAAREVAADAGPASGDPARALLDQVDAPRAAAAVTLASGRRYELESGEAADRLVIRGRRGEVVLRIEVTDAGPVLSFSGAELELSAARRIALAAPDVDVRADRDLTLSAGGSLRERVTGDRHAEVGGDARLEAAAVELQASAGHVEVVAMRQIALDAERIGLNDKPAPGPFPWSRLAEDEAEDED